MKKLIFILVCLMSFSAKADMDKVCSVDNENSPYKFINENCRRNNVLVWSSVPYERQHFYISDYCRFDRNVERTKTGFTGVLYSSVARERLHQD